MKSFLEEGCEPVQVDKSDSEMPLERTFNIKKKLIDVPISVGRKINIKGVRDDKGVSLKNC